MRETKHAVYGPTTTFRVGVCSLITTEIQHDVTAKIVESQLKCKWSLSTNSFLTGFFKHKTGTFRKKMKLCTTSQNNCHQLCVELLSLDTRSKWQPTTVEQLGKYLQCRTRSTDNVSDTAHFTACCKTLPKIQLKLYCPKQLQLISASDN